MFPVEAFCETLIKAMRIFQRLEIRRHLTGGVASVYYGEPRMAQVIDIVVDNSQISSRLTEFIKALEESDFLFNADSFRHAVANRGVFQLLDRVESLKLDICPRELIPGELDRSVSYEVFAGVELPLAACADIGASKLIWISKGSHKSRRDLRQLFLQASDSDRASIRRFANEKELVRLLEQILSETDEIS